MSTAYVNGQRTGKISETLLPENKAVAHLLGQTDCPAFDLDAEIKSIEDFSRVANDGDGLASIGRVGITLQTLNLSSRI